MRGLSCTYPVLDQGEQQLLQAPLQLCLLCFSAAVPSSLVAPGRQKLPSAWSQILLSESGCLEEGFAPILVTFQLPGCGSSTAGLPQAHGRWGRMKNHAGDSEVGPQSSVSVVKDLHTIKTSFLFL